jgi:hypothetical protein
MHGPRLQLMVHRSPVAQRQELMLWNGSSGRRESATESVAA